MRQFRNETRTRSAFRAFGAAVVLLATMSLSCAVQPPGSGAATTSLSGVRLRVLMQFAGNMNPGYYYYFLINNTSDINAPAKQLTAPGPIAVVPGITANSTTGFGNGFAESSDGTLHGFTDYVSYNVNNGSTGVGLYHVTGGSTGSILVPATNEGNPVSIEVSPNGGGTTLEFDIDLAQLMYDSSGNKVTNPTTIQSMLANMQYLQCNIVSTNIVNVDQNTNNITKAVDAMGDGTVPANFNDFLVVDVTKHGTTYSSSQSPPLGIIEPPGDDVFGGTGPGPNNDDPLNLISWTITPVVE